MKVMVEVSDEDALKLHSQYSLLDGVALDVGLIGEQISRLISSVLNRANDPIPERAMTLLREGAMQKAISSAAPGEGSWETKRRADEILDWVLGAP